MHALDSHDHAALIAPLFRYPRRFWATVIALLLLITPGLALYLRQVILGLGVTDLNRPAYWGIYLVNFIFLIGVSMAGTLISAVLQLLGVNWRRPITRMAEALTVFGLMIAGLQIIVDMGRPDRLVFTLLYGRFQSPLLWDILSLTLYLLTALFALYLELLPDIALLRDTAPAHAPAWQRRLYQILAYPWKGNAEQWRRLEKVIRAVSLGIIPIGISLHTVTSWLFSTTVQPGWRSTILGPYFIVGAVFSGIGLLFIVVSLTRRFMHLETYIPESFYTSLGWILIVMSANWYYFTGNEMLIITAEQETLEFPVMAAKLWGEFAPTFWGMVALMVAATWILVAPKFFLAAPSRNPLLQTRLGLVFTTGALALFAALSLNLPALAEPNLRTLLWALGLGLALLAGLGLTKWFRQHFIATPVIAGAAVLVGMWLERWNIIIPTVTHPRLIPYATYTPTLTEIAVTISAVGMLALLFVLFFKIFPVVSIWEIEEGRALQAQPPH